MEESIEVPSTDATTQLGVRSAVPMRLQMSAAGSSPESTPPPPANPRDSTPLPPASADPSFRSDMSLTDSDDTPMALSP